MHYNREPTDLELCHFLDIGLEKLESIKHAVVMTNVGSLDVPIGEDDEGSMYELIPGQDNAENEVIERLQQEQLKEILWNMVDKLPDHEPAVLRMRYQEGKTLKEAGEQIGTSVEHVRQIQSKALRNMREPRRALVLQSLIDGEYYSRGLKGSGVKRFKRTWTSSTEYAVLGYCN